VAVRNVISFTGRTHMKEIRVLSATGILGSGFREETMKRAMTLKPDFIGADC
jgi:hypothetical protein